MSGRLMPIGENISKEDWAGQSIDVRMGPFYFGVVRSFDEAAGLLRALANMAELLPNEEPITALADMFYDLKSQRERLLEPLSPMVIEKWLVDGCCALCPSGG